MSEQPPYKYSAWPAWRYGPGGEAKVFQRIEDVPVGWVDTPQPAQESEELPDTSAEQKDAEESYGGFSRSELEQVLRRGGQRIYARDSAFKMYTRAEKASLIENGQLAGAAADDFSE